MSIFNAYIALSGRINADVTRKEALSRHTSLRIGGPASLFVTVHDLSALTRTIEVLREEKVPWVVLGRGTNVIASDAGYTGCVISLGHDFSHISVEETALVCGGAAKLTTVMQTAMSENLAGAEFLSGIPGTIGGAVRMNAGTRTEWIYTRIRDIVCLVPGKGLTRYNVDEIEWGYRSCSLRRNDIILEVTLALMPGNSTDIAADIQRRLARRKQQQPIGFPSCGSVFKNPEDASAGRLISECGLAGLISGDAQISETHANFIVNLGRASAANVCTLMTRMHDEVLTSTGYDLVPEVKLLGFEG